MKPGVNNGVYIEVQTFLSGAQPIRMESRVESPGESEAKRFPALLILHGSEGMTQEWFKQYSAYCAGSKYAVFAPYYFDRTGTTFAYRESIPDHFPAWLETAQDALACVARHPQVDAGRIAVLGISLGGYLATTLASQNNRVCAVVEAFGGIPEQFASQITPAMPPVLILHGDADNTVPVSEAQNLDRLLTFAGVEHVTKIYRGQGHRFSGLRRMDALFTILRFLDKHLKPATAFETSLTTEENLETGLTNL